MRVRFLAVAAVLCAAGCGSASAHHSTLAPGTLAALAERPGLKTVALTPGDADFSPGPVRYSFLVVADDGRPVSKPTADVWVARAYKAKPYERATAKLETIGIPGGPDSSPDSSSIYVVLLRAPATGTFWLLARPKDSKIAGLGNVVVRPRSYSPAVGAKAPASRTPTLATTRGRLAPLTTATHPDRQLYTTSVAEALAKHVPFVVTFATPKFCTSRTCGPVVDVGSSTSRCTSTTIRRGVTTAGCANGDCRASRGCSSSVATVASRASSRARSRSTSCTRRSRSCCIDPNRG